MSIKFQNKGILEGSAPSTVSCIMNGSAVAGVPVAIYPGTSGALYAINTAVASNSTSWGITSAAAATSAVTDIVIGGKVKLAAGGLTDGQIIASIANAGTATAAAISSSTAGVGLAVAVGTNYAILY